MIFENNIHQYMLNIWKKYTYLLFPSIANLKCMQIYP